MTIRKNDENKSCRTCLPNERIAITSQPIRNFETLNSKQNAQIQDLLERKYPMLRRTVVECDEVAKRKEAATVILPQDRTPDDKAPEGDKCSSDSAKNLAKSKKNLAKPEKNTATRTRMQKGNTVAKHVLVSRANVIILLDPKTYREAMKDPLVKQWVEAMRTEIEASEQNDTWKVMQKAREFKIYTVSGYTN
uniref:AlNc14C391G11285 protein n=1 Tax=Albugo laibachii Nc14 TaxID=890382 RepID=F0WYM1_9STRA|nr:AlNc14C391G11285 [Albugo laibachii Nc14]CCA27304.1 AlNc14C502G11957 [Albugo laibachii Nc14]|eukprot:CCA27304.1 AlNc14C502G11957 [Albugo laibachii Nc14]